MIVHTDKQSIAYCARLGMLLSHHVDTMDKKSYWMLECSPGHTQTFETRLALWFDLMKNAAFALGEQQKLNAFMTLYEDASPKRRHKLVDWVNDCVAQGVFADRKMERQLGLPSGLSVDDLPNDWKEQMVVLVQSEGWNEYVVYQIKRALTQKQSPSP